MPKEGNLVPFNASADKSNTNGAHHKAASVFRPPTSEIANANGVRRPSSGSNATSIISQQPSLPGSHKRSFSEAHLNRPKKKPRLDRQPSAFVTGSSRPVPLAASTSSKPSVSNTATPGKSPGVSALASIITDSDSEIEILEPLNRFPSGKSIPQKRPSTGPEIIEISSSDSEPPSKSTKQPIIRKKRPPKVKENETPHKTPKKSVPPIAPVATKQARPSSSLATPNTSGSTTAKPVLSHSATAPPPVGRTVATPMSQAEEGLSRVRQLISDFISVRSVNVPDTSDTVSPKVPNSTPHGNPLPFPASSRADKGKQRDPGENTGFIERSGLRKVAEREVIDVDAQSLETRKKRKRKRKKFPILVLREGKLPSTSVGLKKPLFIEPSASSELSSHTSEPIVRNPSNHKNDFATERLVTKTKKKDQQQSAIDQLQAVQSPPPILHSKSLSLASNEKEPSAIVPTLIGQSISGNKTSPSVKLAEGETGNSNSSAKPKSFAKSTGNGQDSASTFPSAWRSAATSNSSPAPSSGTDATEDLVGAFASQEEDTGLGTPLSSDQPPTAAAPSSGTDAAGIVENPLGASASRDEDVAFGASSSSGPTFQGPARKSVTSSNDPNVNQPPIGKRKMASIDAGSSATKDVLQTSPPKPELPSTGVQNKQACKVLIDTKCSGEQDEEEVSVFAKPLSSSACAISPTVSSSMELPNPQHLQNLPTSSQKETPASARSSLIVTNHISSGIKETPPGSVGSTRITRQLSPDPTTTSDNIVASAAGVSSSEIVSKEFPSSNEKPLVNGTGTVLLAPSGRCPPHVPTPQPWSNTVKLKTPDMPSFSSENASLVEPPKIPKRSETPQNSTNPDLDSTPLLRLKSLNSHLRIPLEPSAAVASSSGLHSLRLNELSSTASTLGVHRPGPVSPTSSVPRARKSTSKALMKILASPTSLVSRSQFTHRASPSFGQADTEREKEREEGWQRRLDLIRHSQRFVPDHPHIAWWLVGQDEKLHYKWKIAFEDMMALACDFEDPRAPPVKIFNEVDPHVEPHPKFEFLWTNKVILGQDVPKSSRENLKGCGCFGKCDPQSRSCFCVKRQMKNCPELKSQPGFAYDLDETLKWVDYPVVFECNDECDCDPDCPNRVVQRGRRARISIKKTKNKGWGVFAQEHIKEHQFIGIYSGELITENEAEARGIMYGDLGRTYLFDLDFESVHMIKERLAKEASEAAERATRSNHKVKKQRAAGSPSRTPLQEDSGSSSGTRVNSEYTVDAFYVGNHTRYLNHSCSPNCFPVPVFIQESDLVKPLICLFTIQEVYPHEELTFSYFGEATRALQSGDEDQRSGRVFVKCECGEDQCIGIMFG